MVNTNPTNNIAIDVMGADKGPAEVIAGVKLALETYEHLQNLTLVGDEATITRELRTHGLSIHPKVKIKHASQVIEMNEKPIQSLKQKKDSSMLQAIELVKSGHSQAMLSCGNTGALMAGSTLRVRPMPGIERPALSSVIPSKDHHFILVDVGANPDPSPLQLAHNAVLGYNHCQVELGIKNPKVGLLTIGTEEGKGTERVQATHVHLKKLDSLINYTGLIEGFHLFDTDIDVVVCDGFVGNILIKTCESIIAMAKGLFTEELKANPVRKAGALLSMGAFKAIKHRFNPDRYGAAPLLGLNGIVLKSHGSSSRHTVMNAIHTAEKMIYQEMRDHIQAQIEAANKIINA